jgi:hypothetical protein
VGSFAIAYVCDYVVSDKKIFGGKFQLAWRFSYFLLPWFKVTFFESRHHTQNSLKQGMVGGDWQEISSMASYRRATSGDESNHSPEFHCQVPRFLNPILACDMSVSVRWCVIFVIDNV